jgi:hypothetical protein
LEVEMALRPTPNGVKILAVLNVINGILMFFMLPLLTFSVMGVLFGFSMILANFASALALWLGVGWAWELTFWSSLYNLATGLFRGVDG